MDNIFRLLILLLSLLFGILCINKPEMIFRFIAIWARFASGGNDFNNEKTKMAFQNINSPEQYYVKFPAAMASLQRTGYVALFVAIVGLCIALIPK